MVFVRIGVRGPQSMAPLQRVRENGGGSVRDRWKRHRCPIGKRRFRGFPSCQSPLQSRRRTPRRPPFNHNSKSIACPKTLRSRKTSSAFHNGLGPNGSGGKTAGRGRGNMRDRTSAIPFSTGGPLLAASAKIAGLASLKLIKELTANAFQFPCIGNAVL